jgi:class 3 adenylate cyclase/alpha-beta hydrolase superfamily lysophospholipase
MDDVRYARSGDLHIAYKVAGDGPVDVVLVPGLIDTIEAESIRLPLHLFTLEGVSRYARAVRFDKRGTGLSDRLPADVFPTIDEQVRDVLAVMDEVRSERATVIGIADGGQVATVFAASYPERVRSVILSSTGPRLAWSEDWPWGNTPDSVARRRELIEQFWGTGVLAASFGVEDEATRRDFARVERLTATPSAATRLIDATRQVDVRSVLSSIAAPTLIVHHTAHRLWPVEGARYLAEHIADAQLVELPGEIGTNPARDQTTVTELIEEFITGNRRPREIDRVLKTVLFTDIVDSTARVAKMGDRRWRELLDEHERSVRATLEQFRGVAVNTTGDGFFATFDSPARAIECARALIADAERLGIEIRAGIHTGECEVRGDDLAGIAVHIGARVGAMAGPGEVVVTTIVRDLVTGSGIGFADAGRHALKGVPGDWELLVVV